MTFECHVTVLGTWEGPLTTLEPIAMEYFVIDLEKKPKVGKTFKRLTLEGFIAEEVWRKYKILQVEVDESNEPNSYDYHLEVTESRNLSLLHRLLRYFVIVAILALAVLYMERKMRIFTCFLYLIGIELLLCTLFVVLAIHAEKKVRRIFYYQMKDRVRKKYSVYFIVLFLLMAYTPVFAVLLEAVGKDPLLNPVNLFWIMSALLVVVCLAYRYFYINVVLQNEKEMLSKQLREWLKRE